MYFFDTYAILEIINGNPNYSKFKDLNIVTSILNIGELYYALLRDYNQKTADFWCDKIKFDLIKVTQDICIRASYFRYENKEKKLSYVDCIGYQLALSYNLKFLTGDEKFKNLVNVEFVKK